MKDLWAIILAAGSGTRMAQAAGGPKQFLRWRGAPLYWASARTFSRLAPMRGIVFVFPQGQADSMRPQVEELLHSDPLGLDHRVVDGGARRQDSVACGLAALPGQCGAVLVHDAARPFASAGMCMSLVECLQLGAVAAIPAVPVKDTVKCVREGMVQQTLERARLVAVQTPQAFDRSVLEQAHERARQENWEVTDDASMVERMGREVRVVDGEEGNIKITTPEDLAALHVEKRAVPVTGWGYDVHRYGPGRPMMLGGVTIQGGPEVVAHSDGDVLLHALTDAVLGTFGGGDIGRHFPDTDPANDNLSSSIFVKEAMEMAHRAGVELTCVDMTIIAQTPRLVPWHERIRRSVARLLELDEDCVNVKATTEEKLGFTGRKEGIKAVVSVAGLRSKG